MPKYHFLVTVEGETGKVDEDYPFTEADVQHEIQSRLEAVWTHGRTTVIALPTAETLWRARCPDRNINPVFDK